MVDVGMNHADMSGASLSLAEAAKKARSATGSSGLSSLAVAIPGSSTADGAGQMATAWREGIRGWSGQVAKFAEDVEASSKSTKSADSGSGSLIDLLGSVF